MQWHDFRAVYRALGGLYGVNKGTVTEVAQKALSRHVTMVDELQFKFVYDVINCEAHWAALERPYYNVWPSVMDVFAKMDLSKVGCHQLALPCAALGLRFAKGHEFKGRIRTLFVSQMRNDDTVPTQYRDIGGGQSLMQASIRQSRDLIVVIDDGSCMRDTKPEAKGALADMPTPIAQTMRLTPGMTIAEVHAQTKYGEGTLTPEEVADCLRLVCSMCLLDNNPDLIEAKPLEKDRVRWEATHDPALLERAIRKGFHAWDVGRNIVTAPGYRNPHFAIRWMGRGVEVEKKPVLRPITGCLVKRGELAQVPTGYLDDEEEHG